VRVLVIVAGMSVMLVIMTVLGHTVLLPNELPATIE